MDTVITIEDRFGSLVTRPSAYFIHLCLLEILHPKKIQKIIFSHFLTTMLASG